MKRVVAQKVMEHIGEEVVVRGWVRRVRRVGSKLAFVILRDYSGELQLVLSGELAQLGLPRESAISVCGQVAAIPGKQSCELQVQQCTILNPARDNLPFKVGGSVIEAASATIFDNRAFSLRNNRVRAIFKVQNEIVHAFASFLRNNGFTEIKTPKLVATGTEGGSELFRVDYFERDAYLAQSPQFYKQMMVGSGLERVYEVGPVFRAESHKTSRHINEFISLDVEKGFIEGIEDLMSLEEALLNSIFSHLNRTCANELEVHNVYPLYTGSIPRITLARAREILSQEYAYQIQAKDIDPMGEKLVCEYVRKQYGSLAVFLTEYPVEVRPFYTMPKEGLGQVTESFDLIYKGTEITTGGQRIHDYEQLRRRMTEWGLQHQHFSSYLNMFSLGMPPHGGFAIGLERLTAQILGLSNVKEACLFPRDMNRLAP